ncbi:MAG: hypothetical protein ACYDEV_00970 [Acidiferrobacter sp.]
MTQTSESDYTAITDGLWARQDRIQKKLPARPLAKGLALRFLRSQFA